MNHATTRLPLLIASALLLAMGGCPRPASSPPAQQSAATGISGSSVTPIPSASGTEAIAPVIDASAVPILLGIMPLTEEFRLDDHVRLEIPVVQQMPNVRALVATLPSTPLTEDGQMVLWTLDAPAVERFIPLRLGMTIDCLGPTFRFQGQLLEYELWQDVRCGESMLVAVVDAPEDDQLREPATWIGVAHAADEVIVPVDESLNMTQPPEPPKNFVGIYERTAVIIRGEIAAGLGVSDDPDAPAPIPPEPTIELRFGKFDPQAGETSALIIGTWPRDSVALERLLFLADAEGHERWRVGGERLDRFALQQVQVEFLADITGDGLDDLVMTVLTPKGARQTMIWSLAGETLTVIAEGTWWGCEAGLPAMASTTVGNAI